jgi:hypothetical protein
VSAKKKAAKKKPAKKKAAKKKAAKKKVMPVPRRISALVGLRDKFWELPTRVMRAVFPLDAAAMVVVTFDDSGGLNRPSASRARNDVVWFANHGRVNRVITLSYWPFLGTAASIRVDKGKSVGPFVLNPKDTYVGSITCTGDPRFGGGGGPGDPQFDAGN